LPSDYVPKNGKRREYGTENFKSIKKNIVPIIDKIEFYNREYEEWDNHLSSGGFVVYCDPPYANTELRYKKNKFDTEKFWKTIKKWKTYGNYIFVSELTCPIEHEEIYSKILPVSTSNKKKKMVDKLFYIC